MNELVVIKDGLKHHAQQSNIHLEEWLKHEEEKVHAKNINSIIVDFANERVVKIMIEFNDHDWTV